MSDLMLAAKAALAALEGWDNHDKWVWPESALEQAKRNTAEAITALRAALAEPAPSIIGECQACGHKHEMRRQELIDALASGDTPSPDQKVRVDYGPDSKITVVVGNGGGGGGGTLSLVSPVASMSESGSHFYMTPGTVPLYAPTPAKCPCNDRPKSDCPGEWEPGCDLGANAKYAEPVTVFKTTTTTRKWIEIPDGWALVPVKPTQEMLDAATKGTVWLEDSSRWLWAAMLAYAPQYKEQSNEG